jgi:uncharacterized protein (DUF1800 family)
MKSRFTCLAPWLLRESIPLIAIVLALFLFCQPALLLVAGANGKPQRGRQRQMSDTQRIAHVLSRLTFGARPGDFERVKAMGIDTFISQQLDPDSLADGALLAKLGKLPTLGMATPVIIEQYTPPKPVVSAPGPAKSAANLNAPTQSGSAQNSGISTAAPAQALNPNSTSMPAAMQMETKKVLNGSEAQRPESMKALEAIPRPGGLQQPIASETPAAATKPTPPKSPQMVVMELQRAALLRAVYSERQLYELMVDFWENHFSIFGYKDDDRYLVTSFDRDTIRPFAMGRFRDLLGATAHSPAMLYYLDNWRSSVARPYPATKDKPAGVDGGLNENYARELMELHTMGVDGGYTQKDVQEVARCFSGWTIQKPNEEGLFLYRPGLHDKGVKVVLGHKILAGGGLADGEQVLDILATHPATARLIATKLARRFLSDDPPQSAIDRAAAVFRKTDGSIRETLRAIITAPEFFSPTVYRAKVRTPFEYIAAAIRALNAETSADPDTADWSKRMGQQMFGRVTPDGYPDRAEQWLTAGALLARFNFASALATNKLKGTHFDPAQLFRDVDLNNRQAVADRLTKTLLTSDVSAQTREALAKIGKQGPTLCAPNINVKGVNYVAEQNKDSRPDPCLVEPVTILTMLIGSPEFQRR